MKEYFHTGAYALILQNNAILLTHKKSGPYKGLWDLPGGRIEYSETPLQALHRELSEELAFTTPNPTLLTALSHHAVYHNPEPYRFHHIGIIFLIHTFSSIPNQLPQDESRWFPLTHNPNDFTPFVRQLLKFPFINNPCPAK